MGASEFGAVGGVAAFFGAVGADRFGVRLFPEIGSQRFIVGRSGVQLIQDILEISPYVQIISQRGTDQCQQRGRKRPGNPFRFAVVSRQHRRRGEDQG